MAETGLSVIYAREPLPSDGRPSIFLMGPTPRDEHTAAWRPPVIPLLRKARFDGHVIIPEDRPDADGVSRFRGDYVDQVEWEEAALVRATVIMAYFYRDMATLPGLTTNDEWGVWKYSGKVVAGFPSRGARNKYQLHYARKLGIPYTTTMRETVNQALWLVRQLTTVADNCIFCKIANHDPHNVVEWSSPTSVVITPLDPVVPGHRLVIPRRHVSDYAADPRTTGAVMADAASYANFAGVDQSNIITSRGPNATQTVFHLHVHIVPREANDGLKLPWYDQQLAKERAAQHARLDAATGKRR